jgi:hypothetical protein
MMPIAIVAAVANTGPAKADVCSIGDVAAETILIRPRPATFYSVDALNPDVVRYRGRWLMYFSGNRLHGAYSAWRTGLATAPALMGPWRVRPGWSIPYLNGGSVVWHDRLWQAAQPSSGRGLWLLSSRDGLRWRRVLRLPFALDPYQLTADHSLQVVRGALRVWVTARHATVGLASDIAYYDLRNGRPGAPRRVLGYGRFPWAAADVGEPAVVRLPQGLGMFYSGTATVSFVGLLGFAPRSIGLAVHRRGGWQLCPAPVVAAGSPFWAHGGTATDASVIRLGRRTYVFFGAGPGLSIISDLAGAIGVRLYARR